MFYIDIVCAVILWVICVPFPDIQGLMALKMNKYLLFKKKTYSGLTKQTPKFIEDLSDVS